MRPSERIEQRERIDLVVEEFDAQGQLGVFGREDVDGVAAHAEGAARKVGIVALVLHADELGDHVALAHLVAIAHDEAHLRVVLGLADAVDGRDGGDDDHVAALEQALGGGEAHLLDGLVDGAVLLDEQVALGHVGLGLVIVVVADEVLDGVVREELAELGVELRRQGLVGREDDGRPTHAGDDVGHGEGLARAGHAQQGLVAQAVFDAFAELGDGGGLVTRRRVGLKELERRAFVTDELTRVLPCGRVGFRDA